MIDDDADPSIMAVLRPIVAGLSPDHAHSLNIIVSIIIILLILIIIIIFFGSHHCHNYRLIRGNV